MPSRTPFTAASLAKYNATDHAKMPKGWLGYSQATANQAGVGTSPTDLDDLSVTVTVGTDRLVKISGYAQGNTSTTASFLVAIVEDGVEVGRVGKSTPVNASVASVSGFTVVTPTAGSHTYKLTGETSTGTVTFEANASAPAWILVEDIGPAS